MAGMASGFLPAGRSPGQAKDLVFTIAKHTLLRPLENQLLGNPGLAPSVATAGKS